MPEFIPGLRLGRLFFEEAVRPILETTVPALKYSAALIGSGSEILGFDDEMSADHHWGPRVMLFLSPEDLDSNRDTIVRAMRERLPPKFLGYSTNYSEPDPNDNNVQRLVDAGDGPINHRVDVFTIRDFLISYFNFDINATIETADWLTFPEHKLRAVTTGEIFVDAIGLEDVRERFRYFPHDVWLYLLASGWKRIGQEEHLMGRAGMAGDEIGSAPIGSRLVRDIMRLCFLMERQYAPYPKWFGTAFARLSCAEVLSPFLTGALQAVTWQERESHLTSAYENIAAMHNRLEITDKLPAKAANFFGRPFKVIDLIGGFSDAIAKRITEPEVRRIADNKLTGSIDQFSDSTDILSDPRWRLKLKSLYD